MKEKHKHLELIAKMNASEKRFFKIEAAVYDKSSNKKNLIFFFDKLNKAINKNIPFSKIEKEIPMTSSEKFRLYNKILDSLVSYNKSSNQDLKVLQDYAKINILYDLKIYEEASNRINKLKAAVDENSTRPVHLMITELEAKILTSVGMKHTDRLAKLNELLEKLNNLYRHYEFRKMACEAAIIAQSIKIFDKSEKGAFFEKYTKFLSLEIENIRKENLQLLLITYTFLSHIENDFTKYFERVERIIKRMLIVFKEHKTSLVLLGCLNNYLHLSFKNQKKEAIIKSISLSYEPILNSKLPEIIQPYLANLNYGYFELKKVGDLDIQDLIDLNINQTIIKELTDINFKIYNENQRSALIFHAVGFQFKERNYTIALELLNNYIYRFDLKIVTEFYFSLYFLLIFKFWSESNHISSESILKKLQYTYKKNDLNIEHLKELINICIRINRSFKSGKRPDTILKELIEIVKRNKDKYTCKDLFWLEVQEFIEEQV